MIALTVIWAKSYFYDLFTIASEDVNTKISQIAIISYNSYISLAPSTLLDMELFSRSFFVLKKNEERKE